MKIRFVTSSLVIAASIALAADPLSDRSLTLEDSVKLALNNSPLLLGTREDVNISLQRVQQAESLFYPKLDLNANWSKFGVDGDTPLMIQPQLGPTLVPNNPHQNYYTFRANIYQSVYEGGRGRNTWKQARIAYERSKDLLDSMQIQVASSAKQSFYDLLFAQTRLKLITKAVESTERYGQEERGSLASRIRLEHWRSMMRTRQAEAVQAEAEARLSYLRVMNLELSTQVVLDGTLKPSLLELDLQKLLAWASRYRSELRQTEYQQESDALGIRLSLAERTPRVALGATYERTGYDADLQTVNWAGTLNVSLPVSISDIIFGWAKVKERKAQYRQATLRHAETSDLIERQVRQAYADYRFWQEEIPRREEDLKRMRELLRDADSLSASERWEAQNYAADAEIRYQEAVHDHLWSLAALERAVGRDLNDL